MMAVFYLGEVLPLFMLVHCNGLLGYLMALIYHCFHQCFPYCDKSKCLLGTKDLSVYTASTL